MEKVVIIGSGPAGHTAALYLARANLEPLLLEGDFERAGGLLTTTKTVENFPGFPEGIDGFELTERFKQQSTRFGARVLSEKAVHIEELQDGTFVVKTASNKNIACRTIILATGSTPKRLFVKGYDTFWHKGVSTCAVCDGGLPCFRNQPLAVIGGGDSACEEALHLSHTASQVYLVHRRSELRASKVMIDRVMQNSKIEILWDREVTEICGEKHVTHLILQNNKSGLSETLQVRGIFVAIGHTPNSQLVSDLIDCDEQGYIITNRNMETSRRGIWAAGDVQDPVYRQAITSAGSGCVAALQVERYLSQ